MNTILVTGGSGMVGRALKNILPNAIYLDSSVDLRHRETTDMAIRFVKPSIVIHLAAKVGGIQDNIKYPYDYLMENMLINNNVLNACLNNKVPNLMAILSTCIYPDKMNDSDYPMELFDMHSGEPTPTNFGYAYSKRAMAVAIDMANKQHNKNYSYLVPGNLYGPNDKYDERSHFVGALIKKIYDAKQSGSREINLFGTGNPLRQFVYCEDLAEIIGMCITNEFYKSMNIVGDEEYSIREITAIALQACEAEYLLPVYDASKPDGQFQKTVSNALFKDAFPFFKFTTLYEGIAKTYQHYSENVQIKNPS